ncbi:tyrosine-type recombinase/integrase [Edaphobacter sp. HDX4]|uniref:tyrosine-type recombinase/integrase n=1 Tax=Edaphobacter sp. HDX4 TaxID=2794064 RepID=UPI002FE55D41
MPTLLRKMENYDGTLVTRLALKLMALTFVRTSELIEGGWSEISWRKKEWVIPKERMKQVRGAVGMKPHYVPLSDQALDVLQSLYEITGYGELMFPHQWDKTKTMSKNTILEALYRMGYKCEITGHGFRGVAATVLHEKWKIADPLKEQYIDLQLAHIRRNNVKAAYDHSKHMEQRTVMMQWWADYLDQARKQRTLPHPKHVAR